VPDATSRCASPAPPTTCDDASCCPGGRCLNGVCEPCPAGQHCVSGQCICDAESCSNGCCAADGSCFPFASQSNDVCGTLGANCGECGNPQPICTNGACSSCSHADQCPDEQLCCGGSCLEGICCEDAQCLTGEVCTTGQCNCGQSSVVCGDACVPGNCCDGDSGVTCPTGTCCSPNGCKDLETDLENCGACGVVCSPHNSNTCTNGTCSCDGVVCVGSKVCKPDSGGCVCPQEDQDCENVCGEGKVMCGGECIVCPPPPATIALPGDPKPGACCEEHSECSCNGECCAEKGDCFWTYNRDKLVVDEFCCTARDGIVCDDMCCKQATCDGGCFRMNPVGGSYRRPGR
jgi:hypothetical protein